MLSLLEDHHSDLVRRTTFITTAAVLIASGLPVPTSAVADISAAERAATVRVICDTRQGSGVLAGADHIVTVGHVPVDPETGAEAKECRVGFISWGGDVPDSFYRASVVHAVLSEKYDLDFGLLKLEGRLFGPAVAPAPAMTQLFTGAGAAVSVLGFPGSEDGLAVAHGAITGFSRGTIATDAVISQGYSGGPGFDGDGNVVGVASRITYFIDEDTGEEYGHRYLLGDMATFVSWLDALGDAPAASYLSFAEADRLAAMPYFIREEEPGCLDVARTSDSPAVYCLLTNDRRFVFPNTSVFLSWYPDFSSVKSASTEDIARFRLVGNMTYKAGSLVKITTDPTVYLVTDTFGTLRPVRDEAQARELFGGGWAGRVKDVPDAFFLDYSVGRPL